MAVSNNLAISAEASNQKKRALQDFICKFKASDLRKPYTAKVRASLSLLNTFFCLKAIHHNGLSQFCGESA
jgi:hypothetical protein